MGKISVKYSGGMSFEASARNHKVAVDLPLGLGGGCPIHNTLYHKPAIKITFLEVKDESP
ncbi:MAG: hypothetical protein ABII89_07040 [Candidatus Omnitrophota bacterium]